MSSFRKDIPYSQHQLDTLNKANEHIIVAVAELSKVAGGANSYIGSLREFKSLVKVKLQLESILNKMKRGIK